MRQTILHWNSRPSPPSSSPARPRQRFVDEHLLENPTLKPKRYIPAQVPKLGFQTIAFQVHHSQAPPEEAPVVERPLSTMSQELELSVPASLSP